MVKFIAFNIASQTANQFSSTYFHLFNIYIFHKYLFEKA